MRRALVGVVLVAVLTTPALASAHTKRISKRVLHRRLMHWGKVYHVRNRHHWTHHALKTGRIESHLNAHGGEGHHDQYRGWLQMGDGWGSLHNRFDYDWVARRFMKSVKEHHGSHAAMHVHWASIR